MTIVVNFYNHFFQGTSREHCFKDLRGYHREFLHPLFIGIFKAIIAIFYNYFLWGPPRGPRRFSIRFSPTTVKFLKSSHGYSREFLQPLFSRSSLKAIIVSFFKKQFSRTFEASIVNFCIKDTQGYLLPVYNRI